MKFKEFNTETYLNFVVDTGDLLMEYRKEEAIQVLNMIIMLTYVG